MRLSIRQEVLLALALAALVPLVLLTASLAQQLRGLVGLDGAAVEALLRRAWLLVGVFSILGLVLGFLLSRRLSRTLVAAEESNRRSEEARDRIKEVLDRYVTAEVAQQILEQPGTLRLGGETKEVTVVLSDLRGFTMLVENYRPEEVVELLNRYFARMTDIIFQYQGTLDKFMGDSIMALFGAPVSRPDDAERAVLCAVQMQLAMDAFNRENEGRNLPPLYMGIGINTGLVVAGNFGSEKRSQYTVIGDQVNLVSRIEAFSLRGQILVSQGTLDRLGETLDVSEPQFVYVKGKTDPVPLYELNRIAGRWNLDVPVREFRRYKRLTLTESFDFNLVLGKKTDPMTHHGILLNVSEGGILARSTYHLSPLSNVKFTIPFRFRSRETGDIYGKVLRINKTEDDDFEFNVEFTSILPEDRMLIRNVVADLA